MTRDAANAALTASLVAHGAALLLVAALLVAWCRLHPKRRALTATAVIAMVGLTVAVRRVPSSAVPAAWATTLQEGLDAQNIRALHGLGAHAGRNFVNVIRALADSDMPTLHDVVRMNLWLAGMNAIAFFVVARHALERRVTAALFTLVFAGNLVSLHASVSELPAELCAAYFFMGVVGAAVLGERARAPRWTKPAALALLALLTGLAAFTRLEIAGIGALALAVGSAPFVLGEARWAKARAAIAAWLAGIPSWSLRRKLIVALALIVPAPFAHSLLSGWVTEGLHPLNFSFLTMPGVLWLLWIPLGVVVLSVLGVIHSVRHSERFMGLPFALIILYRTYYSASHLTFYELLRYMTFLTPIALFLGLFGFREVALAAERRGWSPRWRENAAFVVAGLCAVLPMPGLREHFQHGDYGARFGAHDVLLTRNQQIEVRYMLELMDRSPECVFIARTSHADHNTGPISEYDLMLFGRPLREPIPVNDRGERLEDVLRRLAPMVRCARVFRGLDCNLTSSDGCPALTEGRRLLERRTFGTLPYNDVPERGEAGPIVDLSVYAVAPP